MLYAMLKIIFQLLFRIVFRARVIGAENLPQQGAVILAANHMSNWDPPFLACFMRRRKRNSSSIPFSALPSAPATRSP